MRRSVIVKSHLSIVVQDTTTTRERERASSLFGIVNLGGITLQGTLGAQHTELLNYCLRSLEILESKYYTDSNTLKLVTEGARAERLPSTTEEDGTDVFNRIQG